jgi:hypothetical protein
MSATSAECTIVRICARPWVHAGAVERRVAAQTRGLQDVGFACAVAAVIGVAMVSGDPVRGRDDVDPGFQHPLVKLDVGPNAVKGQAIRPGCQDLVDAAGCDDADRADAGDVADIPPDLLR